MVAVVGLLIVVSLCLGQVSGQCGNTNKIAQPTPQYFSSPNYPSNYLTSYSCSYTIKANESYSDVVIQIKVLNASLEPATGCWRDSVEIIDGTRDFMRSLTSFCGDTWPNSVITSTGSAVLVLFNTDNKNNDYYGFLLAYWIAKRPSLVINETPWTWLNYTLLALTIAVFVAAIIALAVMAFIQIIRPKYQFWQKEKIRRGSTLD